MQFKLQKSSDWLIYMPIDSPMSIEDIIEIHVKEPVEILRQHHRSFVEKKKFNDINYVVKQPNNKNHSQWIRLTTLYRDSEVLKDLKSQFLLEQLGIATVKPVAALEKRKFGMVVDSKIIYQFKPGKTITQERYPEMINLMHILHKHGYLHDDPHSKNFLQCGDDVFAIDCKPKKNFYARYGIAHNNITLASRSDNPTLVYDLLKVNVEKNFDYQLAGKLIGIQLFKRNIKNKLREFLGITHKNKSRD